MQTYTYTQVLEASENYFNGNELSAKVFTDKYALRNNEGSFLELTPDDMHNRLAQQFARIDHEKYEQNFEERFQVYRSALDHFARIVLQGSPMSAIGNPYQKMSASNCVVIESPKDSIGGIFETAEQMAQLYKRRCGVGVDLSTLRPDGALVNNAARSTSGAWSFADFYSYVTRMIGQNSRRGACMLTLDIHHPDAVKWAVMKHDTTKVTGANISLRLTDQFMRSVEENKNYEQRWPCEGEPIISQNVSARKVWETIVNSATTTAEPGLIMWDNMISELPAHCYPEFKTISTNPCSEIALSAFDSCRLISINLTAYVKNPFTDEAIFDLDAFAIDVAIAQQMADNLIDLELELIRSIQQNCEPNEAKLWEKLWQAGFKGRRTGTGTHGLADTLAQLCLRYDSDSAIEMVDKIYCTLRNSAYGASIELSKIRGPFPAFNYDLEEKCNFIKRLPKGLKDKMKKYGRRNISLLTQAPTGSVSIISKTGQFNSYNVSSGVEPVFRNSYVRRKKINHDDTNLKVDFVDVMGDKWQEFKVFHSNVRNYMEMKEINSDEKLPNYFVTSDEINWEKRIDIQATEQVYIDHSISATINLPRGTTSDVVGNLYLKAWKKGLKGVTVYVDGCRDGVLISTLTPTITSERPIDIICVNAPKRPHELPCDIKKAKVTGEGWTIFVGLLNGKPYEMFGGLSKYVDIPNKFKVGKISKNGKIDGIATYNLILGEGEDQMTIKDIANVFENSNLGAFTRTISLALRHGTPVQYVVEQLQKDKHSDMTSFSKVMSRVLKAYIQDGTKSSTDKNCPTCKKENAIIYQEGCLVCMSCGFTKCS